MVQNYHKISKNAIKSQRGGASGFTPTCAKLPQNFKECNQITTATTAYLYSSCAKLPQNFNECNQITTISTCINASFRAKLPQNFKECNQITTTCPLSGQILYAKLPQNFKECNQITTGGGHIKEFLTSQSRAATSLRNQFSLLCCILPEKGKNDGYYSQYCNPRSNKTR